MSANGAELIAAERQRQIQKEGWSAQHDQQHDRGELWRAAVCYAEPRAASQPPPKKWPDGWQWKPKDRLSDLVRAGALIAAEIDRLLKERS